MAVHVRSSALHELGSPSAHGYSIHNWSAETSQFQIGTDQRPRVRMYRTKLLTSSPPERYFLQTTAP